METSDVCQKAREAEGMAANERSIEAMQLYGCGAAPAAQIGAGMHEADLKNDIVYGAVTRVHESAVSCRETKSMRTSLDTK